MIQSEKWVPKQGELIKVSNESQQDAESDDEYVCIYLFTVDMEGRQKKHITVSHCHEEEFNNNQSYTVSSWEFIAENKPPVRTPRTVEMTDAEYEDFTSRK